MSDVCTFTARIRRPRPLEEGMQAELFATNGRDADAVLVLGKSDLQDALVDVNILMAGETLGGFEAYVRRPHPLVSGMVARFFGENGPNADAITAMSLSKTVDAEVSVIVKLLKLPSGAEVKKPKGEFTDASALLWRSGFLTYESVWTAAGTDEEFLAWVRRQPCSVPKSAGECGGDVVPMHVRRVDLGAGMARKPDYAAVPGCTRHHDAQHAHGESAIGGPGWMDKQRIKTLMLWVWDVIKVALGVESMTEARPAAVRAWAESKGIAHLLPRNYE